MATKNKHADIVNTVKDKLVVQLNKRGNMRDDIWIRNVWGAFSHLIQVYHMHDAVDRLAAQMPDELKRAA